MNKNIEQSYISCEDPESRLSPGQSETQAKAGSSMYHWDRLAILSPTQRT